MQIPLTGTLDSSRDKSFVYLWGYDQYGMLGRGVQNATSYSPVKLGSTANWTSVCVGMSHTLLINSGKLFSFGYNSVGELGHLDLVNRSSPVQVGSRTDWTVVQATGNDGSFGIAGGALFTWGSAGQYQLGNGVNSAAGRRSSPVQVGSFTNWTTLACAFNVGGGAAACFGIAGGALYCWGNDATYFTLGQGSITTRSTPVQVGSLTSWTAISGGANHVLGIAGGALYAWGSGGSGQLGLRDTTIRSVPTQVGSLTTWTQVAACASNGVSHSLAISGGKLYSWGANNYGQLGQGHGNITYLSSPVQVGSRTDWTAVYNAGATSFGIAGGVLYGWGGNLYGASLAMPCAGTAAFATSLLVPTPLPNASSGGWVLASSWNANVAGGEAMAIIQNGALFVSGTNAWGTHGLGDINISRSSPTQVGSATNWSTVSVGGANNLGLNNMHAIKSDGTLWAIGGNNATGQLGIGTAVTAISSPIQVGSFTNWTAIANAGSNTFGIAGGALYCWGINTSGNLGLGDTVTRSVPTQLGTSTSWTAITAGPLYSSNPSSVLAINGGALWGWGNNASFALGLGDSVFRSSPTQIGLATNWSKVSTCNVCTLAIKTDGTLWAIGGDPAGCGVGNFGTFVSVSVPMQVGSATNWSRVSTGGSTNLASHTLALKTDGTLWSTGGNTYGQLGHGDTTDRSTPVQVGSRTDWTSIVAGSFGQSMGIAGGTPYVWGYDLGGQLGMGFTTLGVPTPITTVVALVAKLGSNPGSAGASVGPSGGAFIGL